MANPVNLKLSTGREVKVDDDKLTVGFLADLEEAGQSLAAQLRVVGSVCLDSDPRDLKMADFGALVQALGERFSVPKAT